MITVVDVCRSLQIEPTPSLTWSVGNMARDRWEAATGDLPLKALRPKTYEETGSHCFAIYPDEFRREIEEIIRGFVFERARQLDLFA